MKTRVVLSVLLTVIFNSVVFSQTTPTRAQLMKINARYQWESGGFMNVMYLPLDTAVGAEIGAKAYKNGIEYTKDTLRWRPTTAGGSIVADNMANHDLQLTGDRTHDGKGHSFRLDTLGYLRYMVYRNDPFLGNVYTSQFYLDSTINGFPFRFISALRNRSNTGDSIHTQLGANMDGAFIYNFGKNGNRFGSWQFIGNSDSPRVDMGLNGGGKFSSYSFGHTAYWLPSDSTRMRVPSAGSAPKMIGLASQVGDIYTPVAIDMGNFITGLHGDVTATGPGDALTTLNNTGVVPGIYINPTVTVDAKGRVTSINTGANSSATLQQVFNNGSVLSKHDTIFQSNKVLLTDGPFVNNGTGAQANQQALMLIFGVSTDMGIPLGTNTLWPSLVAGTQGLWPWNRASSGTTLINHGGGLGDSSMEGKLPYIPRWTKDIRYLIIGNYTINECNIYSTDTSTYRTHLGNMLDSLIMSPRLYPAQSIIVTTGYWLGSNPTCMQNMRLCILHVCAEKGVRVYDSYPAMEANHAVYDYGDALHLNVLGHTDFARNMANNPTLFDTIAYVSTNILQALKAATVGNLYVRGNSIREGNDSLKGRQYIGGTLNVQGHIVSKAFVEKGLTVDGDIGETFAINRYKWTMIKGSVPGETQRYGLGIDVYNGSFNLFAYGPGFNGVGFTFAQHDRFDSTIMTPYFHTDNNVTRVHSPLFETVGTTGAKINNALNVVGSINVFGNTVFDRHQLLFYRNSSSGIFQRWGFGMGANEISGTDLRVFFDNLSASQAFSVGYESTTDTSYVPQFRVTRDYVNILSSKFRIQNLTAPSVSYNLLVRGLGSDSAVYQIPASSVILANGGVSKDGDSVKLGQNIGQSGNPAALKQDREIPLNGFNILFKNIGQNNTGILKFYKAAEKNITYPFLEFKDQRDSTLAQVNFDSLDNTSIGRRAGQVLTSPATQNTFIGAYAGPAVTTGAGNTFIGWQSGRVLINGSRNTAVGAQSLWSASSGSENNVLGASSLVSLTTGIDNIALGYTTANALTTGNYNIAMGSGGSVTSALNKNATGSRNIAIGIASLGEVGVTTSNFNGCIAFGFAAMQRNSVGDKNIAIGDSANVSGNRGKANVIIGANSISANTTLLDTNVIISPYLTSAGGSFTSNNTVVGSNFHTTAALDNVTILGAGMTNNVSNIVRIAKADQNLIIGATANQSDNGYKTQILGAAYVRDSLKVDNIPTGSSTDSQAVIRNNVIYKVANTSVSVLRGTLSSFGWGSLSANSAATTTVTVTGAAVGDIVNIAPSDGSANAAGEFFDAFVSGVNTVTIRRSNTTDGGMSSGTRSFNVMVFKY